MWARAELFQQKRRAAQLPPGSGHCHQWNTTRCHPRPSLAELLHHMGHFLWRKWKAEDKRKGRWPRGAAVAQDSAKTNANEDITCCSLSAAKPWPLVSPGCTKIFSVSRETSGGIVARIVKNLNNYPVTPRSAKAEEQQWDTHLFNPSNSFWNLWHLCWFLKSFGFST